MRIVPAGVHESRTLGRKAELRRRMRLVVRLAHEHAVHVCPKRRRRAGPARIEHGDRAGVAFGLVEKGLRDALLQGAHHAVLHELRIAPEHLRLVDVGLPDRDLQAERPEALHDEVGRLEFGPAFFRALVQRTAVADHFLAISGVVFHDGTPVVLKQRPSLPQAERSASI